MIQGFASALRAIHSVVVAQDDYRLSFQSGRKTRSQLA
uniref:Uncharacterized protein n=1 Tax=Klebsiella pneumoniae TaxID=573 RepID=A0A482M6U9_KLEPN|nr:hypothetical protein [Klebsiella pneumoniae]